MTCIQRRFSAGHHSTAFCRPGKSGAGLKRAARLGQKAYRATASDALRCGLAPIRASSEAATTDARPLPISAILAGFAAGATLLQFCARLPPAPGVLSLVTLAGLVTLIATAWRRKALAPVLVASVDEVRPARVDAAPLVAAAIAAAVAAALGFCYAAWRADERLADALPMRARTCSRARCT